MRLRKRHTCERFLMIQGGIYLMIMQKTQAAKVIQVKKLLLTAIVMSALITFALVFDIPNPNMLLITGLVVFTSIHGYGTGIVCAVAMVLYSMYFFSTDHSFIRYTTLNLEKMAMIIISVILNVMFVGKLKTGQDKTETKLRCINEALEKDNSRLLEHATTDALTGLKNRFALRKDYPGFRSLQVFVMMMDIDDFKRINDTRGHEVGDHILTKTGEALIEIFGKDLCYRYGGDEFLIICPNISRYIFKSQLNMLREKLAGLTLSGSDIPAHFSGGYVYGNVETNGDLRLMIHHADKLLYDAKRQGKDQFIGSEYQMLLAEQMENVMC